MERLAWFKTWFKRGSNGGGSPWFTGFEPRRFSSVHAPRCHFGAVVQIVVHQILNHDLSV